MTIADVTGTALERHLDASERRRLGAGAAGRTGGSYVSERIKEILTSEMPASR